VPSSASGTFARKREKGHQARVREILWRGFALQTLVLPYVSRNRSEINVAAPRLALTVSRR